MNVSNSSDQNTKKLITILIPVYNEEGNIDRAYQEISKVFSKVKNKYDFEILFTDNHSTDNTEIELQSLSNQDKRVKVIRFSRNFGFQRSVLTGYRYANGDAAVQIDCDLQDPPSLILDFIDLWENGYDVVFGIRKQRQENSLLTFCRRLFYKLVSLISDEQFVKNAGDFRLVDRSVLDQLKQIDDARPYTRGLTSALASRQVGIEYKQTVREHGESKFPVMKLASLAVDGLVSYSLVPLRLASFFGFTLFLVSIAVILYYCLAWFFGGQDWPPGFATLAVLLFVSIGLNAIFIGIVGEYVGRIYDQVRWRPTTIIEKQHNLNNQHPKKTENT